MCVFFDSYVCVLWLWCCLNICTSKQTIHTCMCMYQAKQAPALYPTCSLRIYLEMCIIANLESPYRFWTKSDILSCPVLTGHVDGLMHPSRRHLHCFRLYMKCTGCSWCWFVIIVKPPPISMSETYWSKNTWYILLIIVIEKSFWCMECALCVIKSDFICEYSPYERCQQNSHLVGIVPYLEL